MTDYAKSVSDAASTTSGASSLAGNQHDYGTNRAQDVDKDTGTDERFEVETGDRSSSWFYNGKRTYDLHQTLDVDQITQSRKQQAKLDSLELAEREQRIRHIEAEFNQRMRHADRMDAISNSVIGATLGDMAEKLGRVYETVVEKK